MKLPLVFCASLLAAMISLPELASSQSDADDSGLRPGDYVIGSWELYRHRFLRADGRIVDDDNGSISHSEGQGYGMLIAVAADDRDSFDKMFAWTERELMGKDGLAAWKWDPSANPHVADPNNATDGDLLIAWALKRAADRWHSEEYLKKSREVLDALADTSIADSPFGKILLPGRAGFRQGEQPDGPVVNLSYWVFPALEELKGVSEHFPADQLARNGLSLIENVTESYGFPPDWTSLSAQVPQPAQSFPDQFGYDAVRIPLYVAWAGVSSDRLISKYSADWTGNGGVPAVVDLRAGVRLNAMSDQGYTAISDLLACAANGRPLSKQNRTFVPTSYYPSTLYILSLMALSERYPTCVISGS